MTRIGNALRILTVALVVMLAIANSLGGTMQQRPAGSRNKAWKEHPGNPIITMGQKIPAMLWNDPSVLKEGNTYRMWLSGGDPRNLNRIVVQVYEAKSEDGISWNINPKPVLTPSSDPKQWDSLRIETPSVIMVDGTYHMYYSGSDEKNAKDGIYGVGHATSTDGINWTKDPANPVITHQTNDKFQWGYRGAGEPGAVFNPKDKTFYLYYVSMRFSKSNPSIGNIGILLAKSKDGSSFTHHVDGSGQRAVVLTRNIENATPGAWFGYSTPSAVILGNGDFHLFCGFIVAPGGPATARHVTLVHALSKNGVDFNVLDENVFEAAKKDWKDHQVRSPTVVVEADGRLKVWFAGEMQKPHFGAGIGLAVRERP